MKALPAGLLVKQLSQKQQHPCAHRCCFWSSFAGTGHFQGCLWPALFGFTELATDPALFSVLRTCMWRLKWDLVDVHGVLQLQILKSRYFVRTNTFRSFALEGFSPANSTLQITGQSQNLQTGRLSPFSERG